MRKTVLTFGLISGGILSAMMAITVPFHDAIGFDKGLVIGYTTMILAFLLIFFGVRSYRDNVAGGSLGFGRAFAVGALIAAVASMCYVVTWEVIYFNFAPDYMSKYSAHVVEEMREDGESQAAIDKKVADMQKFVVMYQNPVINAAMTFIEPLPVGLLAALLSAGLLRRRRNAPDVASPARAVV